MVDFVIVWASLLIFAFAFALGLAIYRLAQSLNRKMRNKLPKVSWVDLMVWSKDGNNSLEQLRVAYDWQISQWTSSGRLILGLFLAFVSTLLIAVFKDEQEVPLWVISASIMVALLFSVFISLFCHRRAKQLREEFLSVHFILRLL